MKIVALAFISLISTAYAQEPQNNALPKMAQCAAINVSLLQLHNQIAASITTLSPNPPKELLLIQDSFRALASEDKDRLEHIKKIVDNIPEAKQQFTGLFTKFLDQIQEVMGETGYDEQVKIQQLLLKKSLECESIMNQIDPTP